VAMQILSLLGTNDGKNQEGNAASSSSEVTIWKSLTVPILF